MSDFINIGGVPILGFISPFNTGDTYPVIDPLYGIDGFRNVDSLSEMYAIPELRRRSGMIVGVSGGTSYYKLNNSPWNYDSSDWSIFSSGDGSSDLITGGTYSNGTLVLNSSSGNSISIAGFYTGGTDVFVTGGTYSNGTAVFTNNTGGTFSVNGFYSGGTDTQVTGITYSNNNIFLHKNDTQTPLSTNIDSFTSLTVNGLVDINSLSGSTDRVLQVNSGGTVTAFTEIISAYLVSTGSTASILDSVTNWSPSGQYTGVTITGTYQGQKHYNASYFYEAVADNVWIRLLRG